MAIFIIHKYYQQKLKTLRRWCFGVSSGEKLQSVAHASYQSGEKSHKAASENLSTIMDVVCSKGYEGKMYGSKCYICLVFIDLKRKTRISGGCHKKHLFQNLHVNY